MSTAITRIASDQGFSLTGALCAVALALTVTSTSLTGVNLARDLVRADEQAAVVRAAIATAAGAARRERVAIDVRVVSPTALQAEAQRAIGAADRRASIVLGDGFEFQPADLPLASVADGRRLLSMTTLTFDARGRLVRDSDRSADLAIVLGKPGSPLSARAMAVTSDGATVRTYRWNGVAWKPR